jgi:hypothetical protein
MATENNKNITYPSREDLSKRQKIVLDSEVKTNLLSKVITFVNAIKVKHS